MARRASDLAVVGGWGNRGDPGGACRRCCCERALMATKPAELYDEEFCAWTQQQAQTLREQFQGDNRLDIEHLAEEIEDLGDSDSKAVESFVEQIMASVEA